MEGCKGGWRGWRGVKGGGGGWRGVEGGKGWKMNYVRLKCY